MNLNLNIKSEASLKQQLILSKRLQQALKFLQVPRIELEYLVRQELDQNPMLEEDGGFLEIEADRVDEEIKEITIDETLNDIIDWSNYLSEFNTPGKLEEFYEQKSNPKIEDLYLPYKETLSEHLRWQLRMSLSEEDTEDINIGNIIIGNIDQNGYLKIDIRQIADIAKTDEVKARNILSLIQTFDPPGVCAKDLKETLLIQAELLGISDTVVTLVIKNHLKDLERKNFTAIGEALNIPITHVILARNIIKRLEPYPGRAFGDSSPTQYIVPDIYVRKIDDEFKAFYNEDGLPKLRVNNFYKNKGDKRMDTETEEYIKKKRAAAIQIADSIYRRKTTICRVAESIIKFQKNFFEKGYVRLRPLKLTDIADDIQMHKSTISRTISGKYLHCNHGIFELKYFFNNSVQTVGGSYTTPAAIMEKIKRIIKTEPPDSPYDDGKVTEILNNMGIKISRRTVSKYRNKINILPASMRREYNV